MKLLVIALMFTGWLASASEPLNVLVPIDWTGEPKERMVKELRGMC